MLAEVTFPEREGEQALLRPGRQAVHVIAKARRFGATGRQIGCAATVAWLTPFHRPSAGLFAVHLALLSGFTPRFAAALP